MGLIDILFSVGIIAGAVYILYRSLWKKKGYCPGCIGSCSMDKNMDKNLMKQKFKK